MSTILDNQNDEKKINLKKIKYKLKNITFDEYNKNFISGCHKASINCSYDFLISQYGKPRLTHKNEINKIRASWYIKIKTSNNHEYFIDIYDWEESEKKLEEITEWNIGGATENCEYLDYDKLIKLINYQYKNFTKKQEKLKLKQTLQSTKSTKSIKSIKSTKSTISTISTVSTETPSRFIDEDKYKKIDTEKLVDFTDDDLACILFTRFKEAGNFLMKEALIIHRTLENPSNYNKPSNSDEKKNYKNNILIKKDKSKYNNKKDKSKYNNKK
jgi:hypothetical protein